MPLKALIHFNHEAGCWIIKITDKVFNLISLLFFFFNQLVEPLL